ncbi:hypothetical protein L915_02978 [Phytophthora nicotianae]|uniref:Uncharacterized protein n=1 Tax=Phytophthora nicotianae TaxID=4792 RepID=W2JLG1_PHYNI|nr:hypothetical protein L915_02978 [Phytophthora nicotianae]ETL47285.1 hypothetical protein L916_02954 [Phytophthora nicotianae]
MCKKRCANSLNYEVLVTCEFSQDAFGVMSRMR